MPSGSLKKKFKKMLAPGSSSKSTKKAEAQASAKASTPSATTTGPPQAASNSAGIVSATATPLAGVALNGQMKKVETSPAAVVSTVAPEHKAAAAADSPADHVPAPDTPVEEEKGPAALAQETPATGRGAATTEEPQSPAAPSPSNSREPPSAEEDDFDLVDFLLGALIPVATCGLAKHERKTMRPQ